MDYEKLTTDELKKIQSDLKEQFDQYKTIWAEAYENMNSLSSEYTIIQKILDKRNE